MLDFNALKKNLKKDFAPLKKLLSTQEVADAVIYFLNSSSQIRGTNLAMNSGADIL
jgi:enoyl-[acyl-carrier-protein] reductase (NADH)